MTLSKRLLLKLWLFGVAFQHLKTFGSLAQGKPCEDKLEDCSSYFDSSQCGKHNGLTGQYCPRTCDYCEVPSSEPGCKDLLTDCSSLIESPSQCQSAKIFFTKYCPRTCGLCGCDDILPDCLTYITNVNQCQSSSFFAKYCRKSCSFCEVPSATFSAILSSTLSTSTSSTSLTSTTKSTSAAESSTGSHPSVSTLGPVEPTVSTTTKDVLAPGPIDEDCKDKMPKDCMNLIARDKEFCKTRPEFMKENCARSCDYCGCSDLLAVCPALVLNNKDYCDSNRLFMKTNCPRSCDFCANDIRVKPPTQKAENGCVDKRKRCEQYASYKNYCRYHFQFMSRNCPKACNFCEKEYNFAIRNEWNGAPIDHAPITFQISARDSSFVQIHVSGPFFDDPGSPPCQVGSACDGLWDYEVAEVFFLGKKEKYLEIELSPHGQHLLVMLNGVRKKFMDKVHIEYSAIIDRENNSWTGTAKIPIDYFPPDVSKINAYAIHGSGVNRRYESLYPASSDVSNPDFHRLEFFKPFDFGAMFAMSWSKPLSPFWKNNVKRIMRARAMV